MTTSIQSIDDNTSAILVNGVESFRFTPEGVQTTSLNGGHLAGLRNRLINGNFKINQRAISSGGGFAAGVRLLDRWKAGAGGCTITFVAAGADMLVTVTAGSIVQVVENVNIEGGVYSLSHEGTAQARVAVNGAALSGSYVTASKSQPLVTPSATGGQSISVEFGTGTLTLAQLEPGTRATAFERRPYGLEFDLCRRYYREWSGDFLIPMVTGHSNRFQRPTYLFDGMRTVPTVVYKALNGTVGQLTEFSTGTAYGITDSSGFIQTSSAATSDLWYRASAEAEL